MKPRWAVLAHSAALSDRLRQRAKPPSYGSLLMNNVIGTLAGMAVRKALWWATIRTSRGGPHTASTPS
jgi:hypothetical protein